MTPRPHPGRTERRQPKGTIELTERDIAILILTGLVRYLSTAQVTRFFPSADRALRRLRQLFDAKFIAFTLLSSTHPTLVSLTKRGIAEVAKRDPELAARLKLAGPIRARGVRHHLLVVDARLYAAEVAPLRGAELVRWSHPRGDLHRELDLSIAFGLAPDALAEFQANAGGADAPTRSVVAVEVDAGTESVGSKGPLAKKAERYARLAETDAVDALWIVATGGPERLGAIEGVFDAAGLGGWSRVIAHSHTTARPVRDLPSRAAAGSGVGQTDPRNPLTAQRRNPLDSRGFDDHAPPAIGGVDWRVTGWGAGDGQRR